MEHAQLDAARRARAQGASSSVELAEQRLARGARHPRAQARQHPEAAVDRGRPAERRRGCASRRARARAQQIGETRRAGAARIALARRQQREADGLGGLDQERPVAAVADRGAARAPERVARVDLDALAPRLPRNDGERALAAVGERRR